MVQDELSCKELVEIVTDYLEGALPPAQVRRLEAHLGECEGCVNYIEQMRTTVALTGSLREEDVSPAAVEALLPALRAWRHGPRGV